MTEDLAKKLNTPCAFDDPWLKAEFANWDAAAELRKAEFMDHMYACSGRTNGLYTGLWQEFCVTEAGPKMREFYFEMKEAVRLYEEGKLEPITSPVVIS